MQKVKHALALGEAIMVEDAGQVVRVRILQFDHLEAISHSFFWILLQNSFDLSPHICSSTLASISGKWIGGKLEPPKEQLDFHCWSDLDLLARFGTCR